MEKLQVHLTSEEIAEFCDILLAYSGGIWPYCDFIRSALERGETVSIQRNDNHG
jgi:hypothetical protein